MLFVVIAMLVVVLVAAAVVVFVAYPHRGEELPVLPALGDAMARAAGAAPVLDAEEGDDHDFVATAEERATASGRVGHR